MAVSLVKDDENGIMPPGSMGLSPLKLFVTST